MAAADTIAQIVAENFLLIFVLIILAIILGILTSALISWRRMGVDMKFAQFDIERRKLDALAEKQKREELREAAVLLTDRERQRLDAIKVDRGVLARRSIALMNEVDERVGRLERGTENARLYQLLGDVASQERKLFPRKGETEKGEESK